MRINPNALKQVGVAGVDSGSLLVIDPCYLRHWNTGEHPDLSDEGYRRAADEGRHQLCFANGAKAGVKLRGWGGDGGYPVLVEGTESGSPSIRAIVVDVSGETRMASRVAMKYAERLIPLSGPEVREAAASMLDVVPGGSMSFEGLIELAYLKALSENDEHRAHAVASHFMSESDLQELRERIADQIEKNRKIQRMRQQLGF